MIAFLSGAAIGVVLASAGLGWLAKKYPTQADDLIAFLRK